MKDAGKHDFGAACASGVGHEYIVAALAEAVLVGDVGDGIDDGLVVDDVAPSVSLSASMNSP